LVKKIIGGIYEMPEYQILWLIRNEFPASEYMRKEKLKMMLFFSRMETRWIPEKVQPFVGKWLPEMKPVWERVLTLPWLKIAVRNCNFGYSTTKSFPDPDLHDKD
jgi:hypothetical protein